MKKNPYEIAGYVSMCYLLFALLTQVLGWIVMVYILSTFLKFLSSKTRSNVYDKSIRLISYTIIFLLLYTPTANLIGSILLPSSVLLTGHLLIITILGIAFIMLGIRLKSLEDSLYSLRGQLIGAAWITGTCYILNGITSFLYIISQSIWIQPIARLSGMLSYWAPILVCLVLGNIFLRASRESNVRKMN